MNKIHGTNLGLDELKLYYSFSKGSRGYNLSARNDDPSLVLSLPNSHKGAFYDVIIVANDIELNPNNKPVPPRASGFGLYTSHITSLYFIFFKIRKINHRAIIFSNQNNCCLIILFKNIYENLIKSNLNEVKSLVWIWVWKI